MTITYSDYILQGNHALKNIQRLRAIGADRVELLMDGTCWDDGEHWETLAPQLIDTGMSLTLHPPSCDTNLTAEMETLREASFHLYADAIHLAAKIGAFSVVIHPGFTYSPHFDKTRAQTQARIYLEKFVSLAKPLGIRLLVENVGFGHASLYTQEEYCRLLDGIDPIAGYLIDTGHAHINHWDIPGLIRQVAPRLYGMHIHDNAQRRDSHLHIGQGTIPWAQVFEAMRTVRQDCDFILEYSPDATLEQLIQARALLEEHVLCHH